MSSTPILSSEAKQSPRIRKKQGLSLRLLSANKTGDEINLRQQTAFIDQVSLGAKAEESGLIASPDFIGTKQFSLNSSTVLTNQKHLSMKQLFIYLLFPIVTWSQQKPLSVGNSIPITLFESLSRIPHHGSTIESTTSNIKPQTSNKLIILDFFATFCTSCIRELPKLDSLQQLFSNKLQIIIVAHEPLQKLNALKKKNELFGNCKLPLIAGDSILNDLFPHQYLPHEVWLDQNGKVLAITDQYAITKNNIQSFLSGSDPRLTLKSDAFDFDRRKQLLLDNNGGNGSNLLFQSKFTNYLPGIASSTANDRSDDHRRYAFINFPVISLYQEAFGFTSNRFIIESNDPSRFSIPLETTADWKLENLFSWEFIGPEDYPKNAMLKMLAQDLDRYLNLNGHFEKRKMKCFVIARINSNDSSIKTKGVKASVRFNDAGDVEYLDQPFSKVVDALNIAKFSEPGGNIFLDETNIPFNIDITLPKAVKNDLQLLKGFLSSLGLQLVEVEREIDMFILSDNKK